MSKLLPASFPNMQYHLIFTQGKAEKKEGLFIVVTACIRFFIMVFMFKYILIFKKKKILCMVLVIIISLFFLLIIGHKFCDGTTAKTHYLNYFSK